MVVGGNVVVVVVVVVLVVDVVVDVVLVVDDVVVGVVVVGEVGVVVVVTAGEVVVVVEVEAGAGPASPPWMIQELTPSDPDRLTWTIASDDAVELPVWVLTSRMRFCATGLSKVMTRFDGVAAGSTATCPASTPPVSRTVELAVSDVAISTRPWGTETYPSMATSRSVPARAVRSTIASGTRGGTVATGWAGAGVVPAAQR